MYFTTLFCVILYFNIPYYIIFFIILWYFVVLYYIRLYYTIYHTILYYAILYYIILYEYYCIILYYIILMLCCIVLHDTILEFEQLQASLQKHFPNLPLQQKQIFAGKNAVGYYYFWNEFNWHNLTVQKYIQIISWQVHTLKYACTHTYAYTNAYTYTIHKKANWLFI